MNLKGIATRVRQGELSYVLGRFKSVRTTYAGVRRVTDALPKRTISSSLRASTIFPCAEISEAIRSIQDEAVFIGLNLPADIVAEIDAFGRNEPLHAIYDPNGPTFRYSDVVRGKAPDGRLIPVAGVKDPARCPAVRSVVEDPVLRAIVRGYLGHEPRTIMTILDWTFAADMTEKDRRQLRHHVIDYHYDVGGFNFIYASFYITDTDRYSGAHVMMKRSHNRKPLRMLLGSATASETSVRKQYGIENEITIEGAAGTGFVQDTSCYHHATAPTQGDRLMMAIRFIN